MLRPSFAALVACLSLGIGLTGCTSSSSDTLYLYTSLQEDVAQALVSRFKEKTGIHAEFVRLSTGEAAARLEAERNNPQASLWLGGPALGHAEAKAKSLLEAYPSPEAQFIPERLKDPEHFWTGLYLGVLSFASNRNELERTGLKAPQTWVDLQSPDLKKKIQFANPGTSGTSFNLLTSLITKWGEDKAFDYMKSIHPNVSQYTRSGSAPGKNVAIGETTIAIGYSHDILRLIHESKAPIQITYPQDGTGYEVAAVSLIKAGKNQEAAKAFYDFVLTAEAAQIMAQFYITPLRRQGVTLQTADFPPEDLELIHVDADWAGQNKQRLVEKWNEKIKG